jgi:hypothetical protein
MKRLRYSIVLSLVSTLLFSLFLKIKGNFNTDVLVVIGIFMFLALSISFYFKMFVHITDKKVEFQKLDNIIYSGRANRYLGDSDVNIGGNLYLLKDKLVFQTNYVNFLHRNERIINLKEINAVWNEKTNVIIDNSIAIATNTGTEKFVVTDREEWKHHIEKQRLAI